MKTQAEFFLENAVNGQLTDALMGQMLNLPEGDTTINPVDSGVSPDADDATDSKTSDSVNDAGSTPPVDPAKPPDTPVVLAKDGVHTIPYAELERARGAEKALTDQLTQAQTQLAALQAVRAASTQPDVQAPQTPAAGEYEIDLGDFSEDAIKDGILAAIDAGVGTKTAALMAKVAALEQAQSQAQQQKSVSEEDAHYGAINTAHPDIESVLESQEYGKWLASQPSYVRVGITAAVEGGTAAEVIEAIDSYKAATGKTIPPPTASTQPGVDPKVAAAAAIARAKSSPPTSLSDIPAGTSAHHDESAAMLSMSATGLMGKFEGKTPDQIMELMSRII